MGNLYVFYIVYDIDMKKSEFGILKWYFNGLEHIHWLALNTIFFE